MAIDIIVTRRPLRLLHIYQPFGILLLYVIFSVIYWAAGGVDFEGNSYIYAVLDWNKPGDTLIFCLLGAIGALVIQVLWWFVHILRDLFLAAKIGPAKAQTNSYNNNAANLEMN